MLSTAQNQFYFRLWAALKKVAPKADRKAIHAQLGLPESHTTWNNAHFDAWKGYCLAQTQPANYVAQVTQVEMPEIRKRTFIRQLLAALGEDDEYAEFIISRMQRNRRLRSTGAGSMTTLDTLQVEGLQKLLVALKKECRRRWPKKEDLLAEIEQLRSSVEFGEEETKEAVLKALCWTELPPLKKLVYEALLVVLGTMRQISSNVPF